MADKVKVVEIDHVREKLIELQYEADEKCQNTKCSECGYWGKESCGFQLTADHLITNGATISNLETVATDNNVGGKWISVKDRLPEDFQRVLICGAYKFLAVGRVMGGRWVVSWNNDEAKGVTHWMLLPQPPKGE